MILQKEVEIIATRYNFKILRKVFGYNVEVGRKYDFPIDKLSNGSHYEINVKCDFCDFVRKIMYKEYMTNIKKDGNYYCPCCSVEKMKNSKLEKYGDSSYGLIRSKEDTILKFGVENVFQLDSVKKKSKETKFEKYGDENYTNLEKQKKTVSKIYGVDNISQLEEIKKKKEKTCMINYGVSYPFQNKDIIKKYNEDIKEKYGVDNISKYEEFQIKKIDTCLKKYGVKYVLQNDDVIRKRIETINKNRIYDLSDYKTYRYKVIQLLNRVRSDVFENWDGYDYYDGEYIAENFNSSPSDSIYPTIDHKISVHFAYINNMTIEEVSDINNLCVTKKGNNSTKSRKNEEEFKKLLKSITNHDI